MLREPRFLEGQCGAGGAGAGAGQQRPHRDDPPALRQVGEVLLSRVFALPQPPGHLMGSLAATRVFPQSQPGSAFQCSIEKLGCFSNRTRLVSKQIWARLWPVFQEIGDFCLKNMPKACFLGAFFQHKNCSFIEIGGRRE